MRYYFILTLLVFSYDAWAKPSAANTTFQADLGFNQSQLLTSSQEGKYQGPHFSGKLGIPILNGNIFKLQLNLGYQWAQLENQSKATIGSETSNHTGLMGGLSMHVANLFFGLNYNKITAKHVSSFSGGQDFSYEYTPLEIYAGIDFILTSETRIVFGYGQILETNVSISGQEAKFSGHVYKIGLIIPLGFSLIGN